MSNAVLIVTIRSFNSGIDQFVWAGKRIAQPPAPPPQPRLPDGRKSNNILYICRWPFLAAEGRLNCLPSAILLSLMKYLVLLHIELVIRHTEAIINKNKYFQNMSKQLYTTSQRIFFSSMSACCGQTRGVGRDGAGGICSAGCFPAPGVGISEARTEISSPWQFAVYLL